VRRCDYSLAIRRYAVGERALLKVNEFAAVLNVTPAAVRRWLLERKIASTRIGRLVRIPKEEATRLIETGFCPARKSRA
jgi:excisionase family DNA binding protein